MENKTLVCTEIGYRICLEYTEMTAQEKEHFYLGKEIVCKENAFCYVLSDSDYPMNVSLAIAFLIPVIFIVFVVIRLKKLSSGPRL